VAYAARAISFLHGLSFQGHSHSVALRRRDVEPRVPMDVVVMGRPPKGKIPRVVHAMQPSPAKPVREAPVEPLDSVIVRPRLERLDDVAGPRGRPARPRVVRPEAVRHDEGHGRQEAAADLPEEDLRPFPFLVPRQVCRDGDVGRAQGHEPDVRLPPADLGPLLAAVWVPPVRVDRQALKEVAHPTAEPARPRDHGPPGHADAVMPPEVLDDLPGPEAREVQVQGLRDRPGTVAHPQETIVHDGPTPAEAAPVRLLDPPPVVPPSRVHRADPRTTPTCDAECIRAFDHPIPSRVVVPNIPSGRDG